MEPVDLLRNHLDELARFVELVTSGSVTAAARRLAVPKSTVTRGVARLETALGVALVCRSAGAHGPTEAGAALAARCAPLLTGLRDASLPLVAIASERSSGLEGVVRVSLPPDLGVQLAPVFVDFTARHPGVRLQVQLTLEVVDLAEGQCDLALRVAARRRLPDSSLVARQLATLELGLFAATAAVPPRSVEALAAVPHVLLGEAAGSVRIRLERSGRTHGYVARGSISTNDVMFALEATAGGAGIGVLPVFFARSAVREGRLVRVLPAWSLPRAMVLLVHRAQRPVPRAVQALRDQLVSEGAARLTLALVPQTKK